MINTIIVDDHELFRLGVKIAIKDNYPDIDIVAEAETGAELFALLKVKKVDIILLDIMLPDISGIEIARQLKKEYPDIKILAISAENAPEIVQQMVSVGINGFITKRVGSVGILVDAIRSIMSGFEYFGKDISVILHEIYVSEKKNEEITSEFTPRERQIIELCHKRLHAKEIAKRLEISPRTVSVHKNNIFKKLGIGNTYEMVQNAIQKGIIRVDS